mmetsp:Transcript_68802/g.114353  ORF Transcript_68802/g.114353 Transcript_68802/m.114353 type:complete len:153 (+) Transcript_68802:1-459(+)
MVRQEQLVLRALGFDLTVEQPQPLLLNYLHVLRAPGNLCELSSALLNDSAISSACARRPPTLNAAAAIAMAASMLRITLPNRWWLIFDADEDELAATCHAIADLYDGSVRPEVQAARSGRANEPRWTDLMEQTASGVVDDRPQASASSDVKL